MVATTGYPIISPGGQDERSHHFFEICGPSNHDPARVRLPVGIPPRPAQHVGYRSRYLNR